MTPCGPCNSPPARLTSTIQTQYGGLAPGFAGLYQVNVQIPANATPGVSRMEIDVFDNYGNLVQIADQVAVDISQ